MVYIKDNPNTECVGLVTVICDKYDAAYSEWDICRYSIQGRELIDCPYHNDHRVRNITCNIKGSIYMVWSYFPIWSAKRK